MIEASRVGGRVLVTPQPHSLAAPAVLSIPSSLAFCELLFSLQAAQRVYADDRSYLHREPPPDPTEPHQQLRDRPRGERDEVDGSDRRAVGDAVCR